MVNIREAKIHDRYGLGWLVFSKGTIVVEDRAYFGFALMLHRIQAENIFVTRIKINTLYESIYKFDLPDKEDQEIIKDEIVVLSRNKAIKTGIN